jgi:serine/threonine protein kinase
MPFLISPKADRLSVSTQSSMTESPERKRDITSLRKKLQLKPLHSSKGFFNEWSEDSNQSNTLKTPVLKKKFTDIYQPMEIIGQGSCGVVKRVLHIEENKIYVAKIVRARSQEHLEQIKREFQILSKLQHKNIVTVKEFILDEALGNAQLILEYLEGQTLEELIIEEGPLDEEKVRKIITDIVSALKHVHDKGVCHRDLTASNIIISPEGEAKLIDFSISKISRQELWSPADLKSSALRKNSYYTSGHANFMLTNTGTDYYKAPEVVTGVPYNHSVDMWSLGVITFFALTGYKPFQSKSLEKLYNKISKAEYKWDPMFCSHISHEAVLFVKACLKTMPFIRLSAKEALYHPWVREIKLDLEDTTRGEKKVNWKHESPPVRREVLLDSYKPTKTFVLSFTALD